VSDSGREPTFPGPGDPLSFTRDDVLASPIYADILAGLPEAAQRPAAEYLAAIAGTPDTLDGFTADTYGEFRLDDEAHATDEMVRAGALADIGVVIASLHDWHDAIEALSAALDSPQPDDVTRFLSQQAADFYTALARQRTEIAAWYLRSVQLPDTPRPPTTGTSMCTSTGYIEIGEYLNLPA
jgi:hypothetical protein